MTPEQIKDRERALCAYIESFVKNMKEKEDVELNVNASEAAQSICTLYNRYAEEIVRPTIDSSIIQHYKIIANTELAALRVSPLSSNDNDKQRSFNARLAFHISLCMLMEWNGMDESKLLKLFTEDNEISSFLREHLTWLVLLDPRYQYPLFSNSQVWRLFHYLIRDRVKNL